MDRRQFLKSLVAGTTAAVAVAYVGDAAQLLPSIPAVEAPSYEALNLLRAGYNDCSTIDYAPDLIICPEKVYQAYLDYMDREVRLIFTDEKGNPTYLFKGAKIAPSDGRLFTYAWVSADYLYWESRSYDEAALRALL